ncbi:hypothetical protein BDV25DRAFT_155165 [Aspergillus avenaceus]|uniref:Uncharacterized protein n=1 Tax=Aspergillus avenaceus TaxID=36643 RepID=A0A5N6TUI5_ASPAV|nr:hypothetical protein BDV25DRAFT_155165 [Aspergillus avenaceus]
MSAYGVLVSILCLDGSGSRLGFYGWGAVMHALGVSLAGLLYGRLCDDVRTVHRLFLC